MHFTRRQFLASTAAIGAASATSGLLMPSRALAEVPTLIRVETRTIEVKGQPATVFGIAQPDGTRGIYTTAGERFRVLLENSINEATLIHWHGLTPPMGQDGVPDLSQPPLEPGGRYDYDFHLARPGTNWMHSHLGLQEQRLMAAPLIVRDPAEYDEDVQEVVVMFHDFTFRDPADILAELRDGGHAAHGAEDDARAFDERVAHNSSGHGDHAGMKHSESGHGGHDVPGAGQPAHLHDVEFDAFLANDRTLDDPEVVRVERGGHLRLRLINGASATSFWLDLGELKGRLVAVDGMPIQPLIGSRFEFPIAQRLDILLDLPNEPGAWPVLALREGERARTGVVLATRDGALARLKSESDDAAPPVGLDLEQRLQAKYPIEPRHADRRHALIITEGPGYLWKLNGAAHGNHEPLRVAEGERVEIEIIDRTTMGHPMHLHGHHFQVVAINGRRFAGAMRDTIWVPAGGSVTVAFDANNSGEWALHCHHLYHMASGMMTTLAYES